MDGFLLGIAHVKVLFYFHFKPFSIHLISLCLLQVPLQNSQVASTSGGGRDGDVVWLLKKQ